MGPIWDRQGPGGPYGGPTDLAIWVADADAETKVYKTVYWTNFKS